MEHVLEGQQVALDGDAEVADASQNLKSTRVLCAVLKTLPVHLVRILMKIRKEEFACLPPGFDPPFSVQSPRPIMNSVRFLIFP